MYLNNFVNSSVILLICAGIVWTKPIDENSTSSNEELSIGRSIKEPPTIVIDPINGKIETIESTESSEDLETTTITTTTTTTSSLPKIEFDGLVLRSKRSSHSNDLFSEFVNAESVEGLKHLEIDNSDGHPFHSNIGAIVFQDDLGNQHTLNAYIPTPDGLVPIGDLGSLLSNEQTPNKYVSFVPFFKVRRYHLEKRRFKDCC